MPDHVASEALLRCHICGDWPEECHPTHWTGMKSVVVSGRLRHHCKDGIYLTVDRPTIADAIATWNQRAPAAPAVGDPREIVGAHVSTCDPLVMRDNQLLKEQVARLEADLALLRQAGAPGVGENRLLYEQGDRWHRFDRCGDIRSGLEWIINCDTASPRVLRIVQEAIAAMRGEKGAG